jgi:hypothetical protein
MGALARRGAGGGAATGFNPAARSGGGLFDMLGPMLDSNRNGSMLDDVIGMIGKFNRR